MNFMSFFISVAYAAETILSPVPPDLPALLPPVIIEQPTTSFGALTQTVPPVAVLGISTEPITVQIPSPKPEPQISVENKPAPSETRQARKKSFTIAIIGDSMVDTLGPEVPHLKTKLTQSYPNTSFQILNYGVGATNIEYGITRLTNAYEYLGIHKPSLVSQKPDVVVIESFGYNPFPFDTGAMDKHWLLMAAMVDTIHNALPGTKIIMAATIAPNWNVFGDGAPGVSFSSQAKQEHVTVVKRYLENTVRFAQSQGLPLADVYHPSMQSDGNGKPAYINAGDHIHYSDAGRELFGRVVAQAIVANKLLE